MHKIGNNRYHPASLAHYLYHIIDLLNLLVDILKIDMAGILGYSLWDTLYSLRVWLTRNPQGMMGIGQVELYVYIVLFSFVRSRRGPQ